MADATTEILIDLLERRSSTHELLEIGNIPEDCKIFYQVVPPPHGQRIIDDCANDEEADRLIEAKEVAEVLVTFSKEPFYPELKALVIPMRMCLLQDSVCVWHTYACTAPPSLQPTRWSLSRLQPTLSN